MCDKGFTQSGSLNTHKLNHTGVKPFNCYMCDKGFTKSGHFTNHKQIHKEVKPFRCDLCDKGITQSGRLTYTQTKSYSINAIQMWYVWQGI